MFVVVDELERAQSGKPEIVRRDQFTGDGNFLQTLQA